jgi:hypothetical protein
LRRVLWKITEAAVSCGGTTWKSGSFSSSVPSIEGYDHAVDNNDLIFVDCNPGYKWMYGMKLKSDMIRI